MFSKRSTAASSPKSQPVHYGDGFDVWQDEKGYYLLNADGTRLDFADTYGAIQHAREALGQVKPAARPAAGAITPPPLPLAPAVAPHRAPPVQPGTVVIPGA